MGTADDVQAELWAYTLARGDDAFMHQHAVDALGAQRANVRTTPMQLTFALVGLYLYVERGYTGRQVQQVHAALARSRPLTWPTIVPPVCRGTITAEDVVAAPAGPARDAVIGKWCADVWSAYEACRHAVIEFLRTQDVTR
jgi:hypothetical protein